MVIGCLRLTDVTHYKVLYDSYGRREKIGVGSLYGTYSLAERLWIDSNGKMETRHPVEGQSDNEFQAICICNHCEVMAAWSRKTWKFCKQFLRFLKKNDPL